MYVDFGGDFPGGAFPPPAPKPPRWALALAVLAQLTPFLVLIGSVVFAMLTI